MTPTERKAAPPHRYIVEANAAFLDALELPADKAERLCWACRVRFPDTLRPKRAHVVARVFGGSYAPENFFLLCDHCHAVQPDGAPEEEQRAWLRTAAGWCEWAFAAMSEIVAEVDRGAAASGIPRTAVEQWKACEDLFRMRDALDAGYTSAAGPTNQRGNVARALLALLKDWTGRSDLRTSGVQPLIGSAVMLGGIAEWESGSEFATFPDDVAREVIRFWNGRAGARSKRPEEPAQLSFAGFA